MQLAPLKYVFGGASFLVIPLSNNNCLTLGHEAGGRGRYQRRPAACELGEESSSACPGSCVGFQACLLLTGARAPDPVRSLA